MNNYKQLLGLFVLIVFPINTYAQQYDNTWLITHGTSNLPSTEINFNNNTVDTVMRNLPMLRTNLTMSDSMGNLLFFSNGLQVYNAQYQLIQNGDSLNPGQVANNNSNIGYPYLENIISIPHPVHINKYYIFHLGVSYNSALDGFSEKLYYTLVDMNTNVGLGRIEKKNQILLENDSICGGQLEVVKHGNGRDWWLIQPIGSSNGYHIFLIADNTITYHHKQYIGNSHINGTEWLGQAIFSHQGNKYFRYDYLNDLDIFDFDRCTGYLSNYHHIPLQDTIDSISGAFYAGLAISPNDRYLYISPTYYICQFDLWATNVATSIDTVAIYDGHISAITPTVFALLQSAPNGKIYCMSASTPYLHVINNPNVGSVGCNVVQRGLNIFFSNANIPSFPHYRTPALSGSACDTITNTKTVKITEKEVQIYPNPTSRNITLESNLLLEEEIKIEIYNALGQKVKEIFVNENTNTIDINVSSLLDGIYSIRLQSGNYKITKSFVVVK